MPNIIAADDDGEEPPAGYELVVNSGPRVFSRLGSKIGLVHPQPDPQSEAKSLSSMLRVWAKESTVPVGLRVLLAEAADRLEGTK